MPFGQQSGPPATARQVAQLLELLQAAGFVDFREARHPFGFTQRQAAGKFTRTEADELIARLEASADSPDGAADTTPASTATIRTERLAPRAPSRASANDRLRTVPSGLLAAELQRRGWIVVEP